MKQGNLITFLILICLLFLVPSSISAQDTMPPVDIAPALDSGAAVIAFLVIMLLERLLGKILPYIVKDKNGKEHAQKAAELLCAEIKKLGSEQKETNHLVKDLHDWHNVQDPVTGRMIWSGLGLARNNEVLLNISKNIESQTIATQELVKEMGRMAHENAQQHTAIISLLKEKS